MKIHSAFLLGMISIASLTSCINENFEGDSQHNMGTLEVNVDLQHPAARATSEVADFPVILRNAKGVEIQSYATVTEVPQSIRLEAGNYLVESHTPGDIAKKMKTPYYRGITDVEIVKNVSSPVDVICRMANSQIRVVYSDNFKTTFTEWDITISDGSETVLPFYHTTTENSVYWYFGEKGAHELVVNFRGKTEKGAQVTSKFVLTKENADKVYDDDNENFCGGEVITITFDPTDATDGTISSVTITADVTFEETTEQIIIDVTDVSGGEEPDEPGGDDGDSSITLTLPNPITLTSAESGTADTSTGDVNIKAENGIKSILVKVQSSSDEMMEQLGAVAEQYAGVDLVNGCEVVGNNNLASFLGGLGKTITIPAEGEKDYTFPIGQFYLFLGLLPGEHNFVLTVTDLEGKTKSGAVKVTITE